MRSSFLKALLTVLLLIGLSSLNVGAGSVVRLVYTNISGTAVSALTSSTNFPASPGGSERLSNYLEGSSNIGDNYGSWIRGFIEAPQTGNYTFWIASDDDSELWLSTDADPANKVKIASVSGWTGSRQWDKYASQKSGLIALQAGKKYYFEVLHKEGGGGDNIAVGWQLPDGTYERPIPSIYLQQYPVPDLADPSIIKQPASITVVENTPVTFAVDVNASQPVYYQWLRDGLPIEGAIFGYYKIFAKLDDNGAKFNVVVANPKGFVISTQAVLTVQADTNKPTISSVISKGNPYTVTVVFSEPVLSSDATNIANYEINGSATINSAVVVDSRTVKLNTTLLDPNFVYTLTIRNIRDLAKTPNVMDETSKQFFVVGGSITRKVYTGIGGGSVSDLTNNSKFKNNTPDVVTYQTSFEAPTDWSDNYGQQLVGFVTAPITGNYVFAIASDDSSELWLSSDENPANKVKIASVSGWTGSREYNKYASQISTNLSTNIVLEAGKRYYIEALMKEGGGGDNLAVTWQKPGDGNIANGQSPIPGDYLTPFATVGPVVITNLQQNPVVYENSSATLGAPNMVDGLPPYRYQWYVNGQKIDGATGATYTIPRVDVITATNKYQVKVENDFSSVMSDPISITLILDDTPPFVSHVGSVVKSKVNVVFTEPVDTATATNISNYALKEEGGSTSISILAAYKTNETTVILVTPELTKGKQYELTVQNVKDQAKAGNVMMPTTKFFKPFNFDNDVSINLSTAGTVIGSGDKIRIIADGSDIWETSDQFAFLYLNANGDFDVSVKLIYQDYKDYWGKCGLMIRETLDAGARYVGEFITPPSTGWSGQYAMQYRDQANGSTSAADNKPANYPNNWIRLQRIGNIVYTYWGIDGTNWYLHQAKNTAVTGFSTNANSAGALAKNAFLGIALTSHSSGNNSLAVLSDFGDTIKIPVTITNQPQDIYTLGNKTVTFSVGVTGTGPYYYQWQRNGRNIAGATNSSYTTPMLTYNTYNGSQYRCIISNYYGSVVTSAVAVLTINPDDIKPWVTALWANKERNEIHISFSEPMCDAITNKASYVISPALEILDVIVEGKTNVILKTEPQVPATGYTVNLSALTDIVGNELKEKVLSFTSYVFKAQMLAREVYLGIEGTAVSDLVNSAKFQAGTPDIKELVRNKFAAPSNVGDNYGQRIYGWLWVPETGNYVFELTAADSAQLWLSTTENPENKVKIAEKGAGSGSVLSGQVALEAGMRYYVEALMKAGTGNDALSVKWRTPSMASTNAPVDILGWYFGLYIYPDLSWIEIDKQPYDITTLENRTATFLVAARGGCQYGDEIAYQWQVNGENIPGATNPVYTTSMLTTNDSGKKYRCLLTTPGKSVFSYEALLTVNKDEVPPVLTAVGALSDSGEVDLYFDELINTTVATNLSNYAVAGTVVVGARVANDGKTVILNVPWLFGDQVSVNVKYIKDLAGNATTNIMKKTGVVNHMAGIDVGVWDPDTYIYTNPVVPGETLAKGIGEFNVTAGGTGLSGQEDGVSFILEEKTGDFDISVKVESLEAANAMSIAGLMARENMSAGSKFVAAVVTPPAKQAKDGSGVGANKYDCLSRTEQNGTVGQWAGIQNSANAEYPAWIRLQRSGNKFAASRSTNGKDWTILAQTEVTMPSTLYVGVVTSSKNNNPAYTTVAAYSSYGPTAVVPLTITQEPQDVSTVQGETATFTVVASGTGPIFYQWYRNGQEIPGATAASYTTPAVAYPDDNGITFSCKVYTFSNPTGVLTRQAVLNVSSDTVKPQVVGVVADHNTRMRVNVYFSEPVQKATAENVLNYSFSDGLLPTSATLVSPTNVLVTTTYMTAGSIYTITIKGIKDEAGNTMVPVTKTFPVFILVNGIWVNPENSTVSFVQALPTNVVVSENKSVTLSVTATGNSDAGPLLSYQWYKNDSELVGQTNSSITLSHLTAADNNAKITVKASVPGKSVTSSTTLQVVQDVIPASIASAVGNSATKKITIKFDEYIDTVSASKLSNYAVSGATITAVEVVLGDNVDTVVLTVDNLTGTSTYLAVTGIKDKAGNAMPTTIVVVPIN